MQTFSQAGLRFGPRRPSVAALWLSLVALTLACGVIVQGQTPVFRELYSLGLRLDSSPNQLLRAADGSFYTSLSGGGRLNYGSVVRLSADATSCTNLFDLASATTNQEPSGRGYLVALAGDLLYGVIQDPTPTGFTNRLIRISTNGGSFTPIAGLPETVDQILLASDGRFYLRSATNLVRVETNGASVVTLHTQLPSLRQLFEANAGQLYGHDGSTIYRVPTDGTAPEPLLTLGRILITLADGSDGRLYGTEDNFPNGQTVFAVNYDGTGRQNIGSLSSGGSDSNLSPLVDGADGSLYGIFQTGPLSPQFWLARIVKAGGASLVASLPADHVGALTLGADGLLYVSARSGGPRSGGFVYSIGRDGQGRATRYAFGTAPGAFVQSELTYASDGRLYGTAATGGTGDRGLVFRIEADGTRFNVLREFASNTEGANPRGGVIEGSDGALYGTTQNGGTNGGGTVFRLDKDGRNFTILTHFRAATGVNPITRVLEGSDGALYGTCPLSTAAPTNGTLWKINKDGSSFSVLKTFAANGAEGRRPVAPLLEGVDGALYGTTDSGGISNRGTIFRLGRNGTGFQTLRHLTGFGDAAFPQGRLLQLTNGFLIGTSTAGGQAGLGSIFRIQTNGTGYQVLHSFLSTGGDARGPVGGLVSAPDGTLLGTTRFGGGQAVGTVFRILPDGSQYTILQRFSSTYPSGQEPWAALIPGPAGSFFGTTTLGGFSTGGTLFRLDLGGPLPPPQLTIQPSPTGYEIVWPEGYPDFELQTATDPGQPNAWQPVTPKPAPTAGQFRHPVSGTTPAAFFRLVKSP